MIMRRCRISARPVTFGWILLVALTGTAHAEDEALQKRLDAINQRSDGVRDLTADFTEEKFTVLLKKPMVSKGRVRAIGSRTRWDTSSPHPSTMFTNETEVAIYFPDRKAVEIYPIDRRLQPLVVSPIPRLATLRRHFDMEELPAKGDDASTDHHMLLKLIPKSETIAEHVEDVRVRIDTRLGLADRVEVTGSDGDRTVITFTNLRTNIGLSEDDVAQAYPAGTKRTYPLESKDESDTKARSKRP